MNLPNRLTVLRMALVPVFIVCFYLDTVLPWWNILAAVIFLLAALTDLIDGWYARKYNMVTDFGKLLDPMADKLLVCSAFIMLTATETVSPIITIVVIGREFIISAFRLIAVEKGIVIAADKLGKYKTFTQCAAIVMLLLHNPIFSLIDVPMDRIVLYVSLLLTVWSLCNYLYQNRKVVESK